MLFVCCGEYESIIRVYITIKYDQHLDMYLEMCCVNRKYTWLAPMPRLSMYTPQLITLNPVYST